MDNYQKYIYKSRYARYLEDEGRREDWDETVARYFRFMKDKYADVKGIPWNKLENAVLNMEVMPSMRCLMTAGPALERDNVAGYNCAYVAVDNTRVFDEVMYILMCGTGVGFSVERQYINKLPEVAEEFHDVETIIHVRDSKTGWANSYRQLIGLCYAGSIPRWDTTRLRQAGERLKVFGGRASGPEPLEDLFRFTVSKFKGAAGRRLNSEEVHDIICKVADVVVCGGVRRSALLSLSNLTDERMRHAKSGQWYDYEPQRALANNSVAYTEKPDMGIFMREWESLYASRSGERGIFYRGAARDLSPERRDLSHEFGTNPCSEIVLRSKQFCNLTEAVVRPEDKYEDIREKVRIATILGTMQAGITDFRYLSKKWKQNTEEEALLGVSLTGIMDHKGLSNHVLGKTRKVLGELKDVAVKTNRSYSKKLGVNQAAAITCVKPSGTVSQLVDSSSGIHPRYSGYYIRRVRGDVTDPLCAHLLESGVPMEPAKYNSAELIFSFPVKSPVGSITVADMDAIRQLEHWKMYATEWCEHKPSVSIYVREDEWLKVGAWVYENFYIMSGVAFFPYDDHIYAQAPYEPISKEKYEELVKAMPDEITFEFDEHDDNTSGSQELACSGGACEL